MIKTPVYYRIDSENMYDRKGGFIAHISRLDVAADMQKRINMHDELSLALKDLIEIVGELEEFDAERINKSFRWICEIYQNAIKVLEQCK